MASLVHQLLNGYQGKAIVIAYNRQWHYLPSLIQSRMFRAKGYLDLEDGYTLFKDFPKQVTNQIRTLLFDHYCHNGALLAAKALKSQVKTRNTFICYGCTETKTINNDKWSDHPIQILFGGSLLMETGAQLFIDTITWLESKKPDLKKRINFIITGYGPMSAKLSQFSTSNGSGWIKFLGDIDRENYLRILSGSHVGLCLKLGSSEMGKTTFPSKILEYASYGLAIITTKVSDVPELLDENSAIFLNEEEPQQLADIFKKIGDKSFDLQSISRIGQERINSHCSTETVGKNLKQFLLKENNQ